MDNERFLRKLILDSCAICWAMHFGFVIFGSYWLKKLFIDSFKMEFNQYKFEQQKFEKS